MAKLVYKMSEIEGWNTNKIFNMLSDMKSFKKFLDNKFFKVQGNQTAVVERMLQDEHIRWEKQKKIAEQRSKEEDNEV